MACHFIMKVIKDVLTNKKTSEEIMGASGLQSYIIFYLLKVLYSKLDDRKYIFLTNEIGTHIDKNNNLSGDVYIYEKAKLSPEKINTRAAFRQYVDIAPKIAVEIDIRMIYLMKKILVMFLLKPISYLILG